MTYNLDDQLTAAAESILDREAPIAVEAAEFESDFAAEESAIEGMYNDSRPDNALVFTTRRKRIRVSETREDGWSFEVYRSGRQIIVEDGFTTEREAIRASIKAAHDLEV
jgi:hypothetical protein